MIRKVLRIGLFGAAAAWIADRWLARRSDGRQPSPIKTTMTIDAPIERVWDVLADIEGQPSWMWDLKAVRIETPGEIGVGTRAEGDVRIFGFRVLDPITITAFEPPRHFAIRHEGRFEGRGEIRLEPGDRDLTTVVHWSETLVPPLLPHLGSSVLAPLLGRVFRADLDRLRTLVERRRAS